LSYAAGSFRDAESLLDQLVSFGAEEIKLADVRRVLGSAPEQVISGIVRAVVVVDVEAGLQLINEALDSGVEPRQLTREVLEYLRGVLLLKNGGASLLSATPEALQEMQALAEGIPLRRLLATVRLFNEAATQLKTGVLTQLPLELALVEATLQGKQAVPSGAGGGGTAQPRPTATGQAKPPAAAQSAGEGAVPEATQAEPGLAQPAEDTVTEGTAEGAASSAGPTDEEGASQPRSKRDAPRPRPEQDASGSGDETEVTLAWLQENWLGLLEAIRPHNRMVEALLKSCEPLSVENGVVTLGFYHNFHKERVSEEQSTAVVVKALSELSGQALRVKCQLLAGDREQQEKQKEASRREQLLNNPVVHEAVEKYGARVVDVH
jgi:DNA polymerase-3 subunit gamma/tau